MVLLVSHFGIVGDVFTVVPQLIQALQERSGQESVVSLCRDTQVNR